MKDYPIDDNAMAFVQTLKKISRDIELDMVVVINRIVDRTFESMLIVSPVDMGNYMASHRIGKDAERTDFFDGDFGGERKSAARRHAAQSYAKQQADDFWWNKNVKSVWFSNNVGHAIDVEDGGPRWRHTAPYKVYEHAERRMRDVYIQREVERVGL